MTAPVPTPASTPTTIDGKYQVVRELSRHGNVILYEVQGASGEKRRVAWFEVGKSADRQRFHTYRTTLRALAPAGLIDVVARPGAYYAVWQDVPGVPLADYLTQPVKQQEAVESVGALGNLLAEKGLALVDTEIMMDGPVPSLAYVQPVATRTTEEIQTLNGATLAALSGGKVKKARKPREPGAWLTFIPGLLFLGGAVYLGAQAAQIYLNPPIAEVKSVVGRDAREAALALTKAGFRVDYAYGDSGTAKLGEVLRQEPSGGTTLPIGRQVLLTVNKPQPLTVPKIEDLTLEQAKGPLKDNILKIGKVVKVDGTLTNTPEGRIVAQVPPAGSTAQRGQPIQVMVSTGVRGKETFITNLRGMTFEQARDMARDAGLVVTKWTKQPSDLAENIVLDQTPKEFVRVPVGSPVTLVIATAKYSPPAAPAGKIPLPPPYVPPPPEPEPLPTDTVPASDTPPADTTVLEAVPPAIDTPPAESTPQPETPESTPQPPSASSLPEIPALPPGSDNAATETRQVTFSFVFPTDLPDGAYTVVVQDADGEHSVMPEAQAAQLRGLQATAPATVRGNAVFIIRVNGQEYTRVAPQ